MPAPTEATRLKTGYYNSNVVSVTNPGGFAANGHEVNFPAALADVGTVAEFVGLTADEVEADRAAAEASASAAAGSATTANTRAGTATTEANRATTEANRAATEANAAAASAASVAGGPVASVNGRTGIVTLTAADVGAATTAQNAAKLDSTGGTAVRPVLTDYRLTASSLGAGVAIATSAANYFQKTITAATTFTFATGATSGSQAAGFTLELTNGGAFAVTWPSSVKWPLGVVPTLTAAGVDVLAFVTDDGGTTWRGVLAMRDSK